MLKTGILNPAINSLISRVRHTNTLVIADRGFPFWPRLETVDISLVDDIPTVLDVMRAIRANFVAGRAFMAEEFLAANGNDVRLEFEQALSGVPLVFEPHVQFKQRVPDAIGLIRTGDTIQYANLIVESA
ncbi:MAG: RbsD/FucU domain-containing protein [Bryobacteraceae bacterium]|jgi:D-ribose pyranase